MDRESICDSRMGISWIFNVASLSSVSLTSCICKGPFHHLCQLHLRITNRGYAAFPFAWNCLVSDGCHTEGKALNISHGYVCFGKKWVSISHWITFTIIRVSLSITAVTLMASLCYSNRKQQMLRAPAWMRGNCETEITTSSSHLTHLLPKLILRESSEDCSGGSVNEFNNERPQNILIHDSSNWNPEIVERGRRLPAGEPHHSGKLSELTSELEIPRRENNNTTNAI